jgi:LmbE family N-acetylglucosaminyl deacetylase
VIPSRKKIIISPHPDDAELGLGGAMGRWKLEGHQVVVLVVCGPGDIKMVHSQTIVTFQERMKEQEAAAKVLGFEVAYLNFAPSARFDDQSISKLVTLFDQHLQGADDVYVSIPSYASDHNIVWDACMAAFRPGKLDGVALYGYEQSMNCHGMHVFTSDQGKHYVEISSYDLHRKLKAMECHTSQMNKRFKSIIGSAGANTLAQLRGLEIGVPYAEVVYLIRSLSRMNS